MTFARSRDLSPSPGDPIVWYPSDNERETGRFMEAVTIGTVPYASILRDGDTEPLLRTVVVWDLLHAQVDAWRMLCEMVEAAGATMTFDRRRYARAASEWPDHLPPMFAEASIAREVWKRDGAFNLWAPRARIDEHA